MKKTIQTIFFLSLFAAGSQILLTSSSGGRAFAANSGNTGAPSENTTCRSCHGTGFGTTVSVVVRDNVGNAITSYVPGAIYDVDFTVNTTSGSPSRWGFQLVALRSNNTGVNGFNTPSANTRIVSLGNGRQYAEHRGASTTNSFSTKWTAPAAGTGTVTFYGGGAAVNFNRGTSGDGGNTTTLSLTEGSTVGISEASLEHAISIYPNPLEDLLNLQVETADFNMPTLRIVSLIGQLVKTEQISLNQGQSKQIDLSGIEQGIYFLQLIEGEKSYQQKLVIK